jgi:hypothetical protein
MCGAVDAEQEAEGHPTPSTALRNGLSTVYVQYRNMSRHHSNSMISDDELILVALRLAVRDVQNEQARVKWLRSLIYGVKASTSRS